jgi:hypothetical protein
MITQLLYSKQKAFTLKGFGFLELLLVMVVCTQQGATTIDNALMCKVMANTLLKEKSQLLENK